MKTMWFTHILVCSMIFLLSSGCSKQNDNASTTSDKGGLVEQLAVYPHPASWKNQHMDAMSTKKHSEASCLQCHKSMLGAPAKLSCAISCHRSDSEIVPIKIVPKPSPNKCSACHEDVVQNKFAHFPSNAGLCTTCHTVSDKHLNGEGDKVITKKSNTDCYSCHTQKDTGSTIHGALEDSESCITCHNPHGGKQRYFIKEESVKSLCLNCHDVTVDTKVKHGAAVDQSSCVNCHNPHSSNNKKLLKLPSKDLCLSCHNQPIPATLSDARTIPNVKEKVEGLSVKHSGIIDVDCTTCHNPHGSDNSRILNTNYSANNNNAYPGTGADPYGQCFTCHDKSMLNFDNSTTGFRTGNATNFHWTHVVNGGVGSNKAGIACRNCHDPHGSNQHFGINAKIKYTKTPNGGNCATACHVSKLRSYHRD